MGYKVYCGWCGGLVHSDGLIEHSHGMCKKCLNIQLMKLEESEKLNDFLLKLGDRPHAMVG